MKPRGPRIEPYGIPETINLIVDLQLFLFNKLFSISQVTFKPVLDNTTKSVMCHFI